MCLHDREGCRKTEKRKRGVCVRCISEQDGRLSEKSNQTFVPMLQVEYNATVSLGDIQQKYERLSMFIIQ